MSVAAIAESALVRSTENLGEIMRYLLRGHLYSAETAYARCVYDPAAEG